MSKLDAYVAPVGADDPAEDEELDAAAAAGSSPTRAVARSAAVGEFSNCISTTHYPYYAVGFYNERIERTLKAPHEIFISNHELSPRTNTKLY